MTARPTVVLLHGLARTRHSLAGLRRHLERAGFATWSCTYASRRLSIAEAADEVATRIARELPADEPLAAVTHSLGGVIIRHVGARVAFERVVMLAPPSQGSRVAVALRDKRIYRWFFGPAGQEVAAPDRGRAWPALAAPYAIIAGTRARSASNPTSWLTRRGHYFAGGQANDGTLAVAETRLPEAAVFETVDASHTWIMNHAHARRLVVAFLDGSLNPGLR